MIHPPKTTFSPPTAIEVRGTIDRGLGVFATRLIRSDQLIEEAPVLVFPTDDLYSPNGTATIAAHVFVWDDGRVGLTMGFGSYYNHSYHPNARYEDGEREDAPAKRFVAIRDIEPGEEITINYNGESSDDSSVGFEVLD